MSTKLSPENREDIQFDESGKNKVENSADFSQETDTNKKNMCVKSVENPSDKRKIFLNT